MTSNFFLADNNGAPWAVIGEWLRHRHRHRSGPQLPADTTDARWGLLLATSGDLSWPSAGTFARPRTVMALALATIVLGFGLRDSTGRLRPEPACRARLSTVVSWRSTVGRARISQRRVRGACIEGESRSQMRHPPAVCQQADYDDRTQPMQRACDGSPAFPRRSQCICRIRHASSRAISAPI